MEDTGRDPRDESGVEARGVLPAVSSPHSVPSGFALREGETVRVLLGPDREDRLASGVSAATGFAVVGILKYLQDLASGDPMPIAGVGIFVAVCVVVGLLLVVLTTSGDVKAIVTDRGVQVRNQDGSDLIPWDDIISVDATLPYTAQYRLELRPGAPALERGPETGGLSWLTPGRPKKGTRVVGSSLLWDLRSRKLDLIQDAMDDAAVQRFGKELSEAEQSGERPRLDSGGETSRPNRGGAP